MLTRCAARLRATSRDKRTETGDDRARQMRKTTQNKNKPTKRPTEQEHARTKARSRPDNATQKAQEPHVENNTGPQSARTNKETSPDIFAANGRRKSRPLRQTEQRCKNEGTPRPQTQTDAQKRARQMRRDRRPRRRHGAAHKNCLLGTMCLCPLALDGRGGMAAPRDVHFARTFFACSPHEPTRLGQQQAAPSRDPTDATTTQK